MHFFYQSLQNIVPTLHWKYAFDNIEKNIFNYGNELNVLSPILGAQWVR
jgi:hypothetical protein